MPPRKSKIRYEDTEEYKKDLIHSIRFLKNDTPVTEWLFLFGDPKTDPNALKMALEQFQSSQGVTNWEEKADTYETQSIWNP